MCGIGSYQDLVPAYVHYDNDNMPGAIFRDCLNCSDCARNLAEKKPEFFYKSLDNLNNRALDMFAKELGCEDCSDYEASSL